MTSGRWIGYLFCMVLVFFASSNTAVPASVSKEDWKDRYDGDFSERDEPTDMAVDAQGDIYVTGFSFMK